MFPGLNQYYAEDISVFLKDTHSAIGEAQTRDPSTTESLHSSYRHIVWTLSRLLHMDQSDLGPGL